MRAYAVWVLGALATLAVACGDDTAPTTAPCTPECRSGFVCALGNCVSACNPPCARGEHCTGTAGAVACVADGADAGDAPDVPTALDAGSDAPPDVAPTDSGVTDVAAPKDLSPAMDAPDDVTPPVDAPAPLDAAPDAVVMDAAVDLPPPDAVAMDVARTDVVATDVATDVARDVPRVDVAADAPPHCGYPGEICCVDISCIPGAECIDDRCVAISRAPAECDHPGVCPSGYACIGLQFCGDRTCYQCGVSRGTTAFGADCTSGSQCASGVCDRGRCTTACTIGSTGDSECASRAAGWICGQRIYGVGTRDGSPEPVGYVTLGSCAQSCARNGDCVGGRACLPTVNFLSDRINFICNVTTRTGLAGTPCEMPEQCQSGLCIPGALPSGGMGCTAPCVTNADCPTSAPACERLQLITPAGSYQTIRGCLPAMP